MENIKIICIMAKSGTGKSTTINKLCEKDEFYYIKSKTTRAVRKNDVQDRETHVFVSNEEYKNDVANGNVIAMYDSPLGYHSYTSIDSFKKDKINVYAIDSKAFVELSKKYKNIYGFFLDLDEHERRNRIEKRDGIGKYNEEEHLSKEHLSGSNYKIIDINGKTTDEIVSEILKNIGEVYDKNRRF